MNYEMYELIAIIVACAVIVFDKIAERFYPDIAKKFEKYYPMAMRAFSWVEANVPDTFGAGEDDPKYAKMVHKADLFLKKFTEFSIAYGLKTPSKKLISEAEKLASALAHNKKGTDK